MYNLKKEYDRCEDKTLTDISAELRVYNWLKLFS